MKDSVELLKAYIIKPKGMFIWRDVPGYEGRYQISNHGEVCSIWNHEISQNDTQVTLINIDKSRHNVSRKKLLKSYWHKDEHYKGEEQWKKLEHFGDYYVSNFGNVKNCKRIILLPTKGGVWLYGNGKKSVRMSVIKLFLNTFPPYELEVNHESKTVNYIKKNENFAITSEQRTA